MSLIIETAQLLAYTATNRKTGVSPLATAAFVAALPCLIIAAVPGYIDLSVRTGRRLYWGGWVGAAALFAVAAAHRGCSASVSLVFLCAFLGVFLAYLHTPYIKFGDHVIARTIPDRLAWQSDDGLQRKPSAAPPDSCYGIVTAATQWWIHAAMVCFAAVGVYVLGWIWQAILAAAFVSALFAVYGFDDATRKLPIARGQNVQAFVVLVASALLWALPPAAYLLGYQIGKRWPMPRR